MKYFIIHLQGWIEDHRTQSLVMVPMSIVCLIIIIWPSISTSLQPHRLKLILDSLVLVILLLQFVAIGIIFIVRKEAPIILDFQGLPAITIGVLFILSGISLIAWGLLVNAPRLFGH
jgi:hypothetical protein